MNEDNKLTLSERDFDDFLAALESDEEPCDKLRELFAPPARELLVELDGDEK